MAPPLFALFAVAYGNDARNRSSPFKQLRFFYFLATRQRVAMLRPRHRNEDKIHILLAWDSFQSERVVVVVFRFA